MPLANEYISRDTQAQQALDFFNNHPALPFKGTEKWQEELVTLINGNKIIWVIPEARLIDLGIDVETEVTSFYSSPLAPDVVRNVEIDEILIAEEP